MEKPVTLSSLSNLYCSLISILNSNFKYCHLHYILIPKWTTLNSNFKCFRLNGIFLKLGISHICYTKTYKNVDEIDNFKIKTIISSQ